LMKLYFKAMEEIYQNKMLSQVADMCYKKCLCEDIGIKCKQESSTSGSHDIVTSDDIARLLIYSLGIIKEPLEELTLYAQEFATLSLTDYPCVKNLINILNEFKSRLLKFVEDFEKRNVLSVERQVKIEEIKYLIEGYNFIYAFDKMNSDFPELLVDIIKSSNLSDGVSLVKQFAKEIIKGLDTKDECYFKGLYKLAENSELQHQPAEIKKLKFMQYLATKNIDAYIKDKFSARLKLYVDNEPSKVLENNLSFKDILAYFYILPYKIYNLLSSYKIEKCYYGKQEHEKIEDEEKTLKDLKNEIDKYRCIFTGSNLDMEIACYLERDELLASAKDMIKKILEKEQVSLKNIFLKLKNMGSNTLSYYKDIREVRELIDSCAGVDSLTKLEVIFRQSGIEKQLSSALNAACKPNKDCGKEGAMQRCLDVFIDKKICQEPIPDCITISQTVPVICYSYDTSENLYIAMCKNCEGNVSNTVAGMYLCSIISHLLNILPPTDRNKICSYITTLYTHSCDYLKQAGEITDRRIQDAIRMSRLCNLEKANEKEIEKYIDIIKTFRGDGYVELLKNTVTAEKLKELYKKYEEGTICNN
ncbi:MAG: hypothetical protein ACK4NF_06285, partial [Planctomycetota bacterium]